MDGFEDYDVEVVHLIDEKMVNVCTAAIIIMSIAAIIGICGCIYIIWLIFSSKCLNITNCYILNRLFADLLFLLTVPFVAMHIGSRSWPFGNFMCKVSIATTHGCGLASCLLLTALSINCYFSASGSWDPISRLFWFRFFLIVTWISVIIYSIPHLIFFGVVEFKSPLQIETHCMMMDSFSAAFYLNITNAVILIVLLLISGYMAISVCLLNLSRLELSEVATEVHSGKKLMVILTILNAMWMPPYILASFVFHIQTTYNEDIVIALLLTVPLPFVGSALNAFIYLKYKGDLLKHHQFEIFQQEPSVALSVSEEDSLVVRII